MLTWVAYQTYDVYGRIATNLGARVPVLGMWRTWLHGPLETRHAVPILVIRHVTSMRTEIRRKS